MQIRSSLVNISPSPNSHVIFRKFETCDATEQRKDTTSILNYVVVANDVVRRSNYVAYNIRIHGGGLSKGFVFVEAPLEKITRVKYIMFIV